MSWPPAVGAKICGLTRREDAEAALAAGADFFGVVLAPGGPRSVSAKTAATVLTDVPGGRTGVFVNASPDEVARAADIAALDVLQLHGDEEPSAVEQLRPRGSWTIWKAVRPRSVNELVATVARYGPVIDGLLLDGWSPRARGGTGTPFRWDEIAPHRSAIPAGLPLIVAGGLRADNLARAVTLLRPSIVDVSSGVEQSPGIKDPAAIRTFMDLLRRLAPNGETEASYV